MHVSPSPSAPEQRRAIRDFNSSSTLLSSLSRAGDEIPPMISPDAIARELSPARSSSSLESPDPAPAIIHHDRIVVAGEGMRPDRYQSTPFSSVSSIFRAPLLSPSGFVYTFYRPLSVWLLRSIACGPPLAREKKKEHATPTACNVFSGFGSTHWHLVKDSQSAPQYEPWSTW